MVIALPVMYIAVIFHFRIIVINRIVILYIIMTDVHQNPCTVNFYQIVLINVRDRYSCKIRDLIQCWERFISIWLQ